MTFIVVPDGEGDLGTKSFEISYRRLRLAGFILLGALILWAGMAISWGYVASQAARVPGMSRQITRLEEENERVGQLAQALSRLEAQYEQVRTMLGADRPQDTASIWLPPAVGDSPVDQPSADSSAASVPNAWPLSQRGFVTREHLGRIPGQHPGIDIAVAEGSYVRAAGSGVVVQAAEDPVYGKFVRIRHAGGYESLYGHASELFVAEGDTVQQREVIALSGNTGTSTAPHLHFEIWRNGEAIDPRELVTSP
ncbi:MAG TPA: M23 family metallopeptidase [Longimicrobiaceae bacterium]|nr:M23 family metallopeptidase [Longimicrobiaceae bacterium]